MLTRRAFGLAASAAALAGKSVADTRDKALPLAAIDETIKAIQNKEDIPGVQFAIARHGETVLSRQYGLADLEQNVPMRNDSVLPIASISKSFTAVLMWKLIEQGRISLDDDVRKYVPSFPARNQTVRIRHLVTNTSGIRDVDSKELTPALLAHHYAGPNDVLPLFVNDPLKFSPGEKYEYSNYAYVLLAAALENAAGAPFGQLLERYLFEPLQLKHTRINNVLEIVTGRAPLYTLYDPYDFHRLPKMSRVPSGLDQSYTIGASQLLSCCDDLVRYGSAFLRPGFLSPSSWNMLFQRPLLSSKQQSKFGYGFFAQVAPSQPQLRITGGIIGLQSFLVIRPASGYVIAGMANGWGPNTISFEFTDDMPPQLIKLIEA